MRTFLTSLLLATLLLGAVAPARLVNARPPADDAVAERVEQMLSTLTSQERVGQLMLVTFKGSYLASDAPLVRLIDDYNIGGVVLLAENDNINGQVNTPQRVLSLTTGIQQHAYDAALATSDRETPRSFVPLFIATSHSGDPDGTQIALGTTPLPSQMALGATWDPALAQQVGQIAGSELSAMGINMLLGPALDVQQEAQAAQTLDLGVGSFGGEPHWVGALAQAYIQGVHEGSTSRIAVIAQNFPGLGLADSAPDEEIPVLPRTAAELSAFDLIPYAAVTGQAGNTPARADGLQCANIRYQGETVRTSTGPLCLDGQAADGLLKLDAFGDWRQRGLLLSDDLGSAAIRDYYDIDPFPHRQVAREAFLAGNDILYLDDFATTPGDDPLTNVIDVIQFFAERYENDPVFRVRVDQSLTRILRLKLALYDGELSLENVIGMPAAIDTVGTSSAPIYAIAQASTTLLSPRREALPTPPSRDDDIVIFTDVRMAQQCSYCATYPVVAINALEASIERMYGPRADAQIDSDRIVSFSSTQLQTYLDGNRGDSPPDSSTLRTNQRIGEALRGADWVVFVMVDTSPQADDGALIVRFLRDEPSAAHADLAVIALSAPVALSSTEISKLAIYVALFSSATPYIDAAARALFQESTFNGALPVSLPAVGYDLFYATSPDPNQTIQLVLESIDNHPVSTARDVVTANLGDKLTFRTGLVLDRNSHRVPDGTAVDFTLTFTLDNLQIRQRGTTLDGIATTSFTPNRAGRVQVTAASGDAARSSELQIVIVGDPTAQNEPLGSDIPSTPPGPVSSAAAAEVTPAAPPAEVAVEDAEADDYLDGFDLLVSLFGLALMGALGFIAGLSASLSVNGGMRVVLGSVIAGLAGYIYYALSGPGASALHDAVNELAPMLSTLSAGLIGLLVTWWTVRRAGH
ncbi:MAG TPA: glycoside hydrolase family 3 N-terminal domain-containing protein [Aggregatilinea sp.]|uniref:glycoside hydrolase family 3 N-terminal domain-containing protein n=1 Tax=Aggregatilinea sp. TaxID=2806333 RepID=UPI002C28E450|nr:glycoside hydrolase family 3 N-terminal domain-containing protein [Aggregatilinea sp.]HML22511.1 glycoside hydrolase family 3 N-terminal domain-containing protein [Aggregatilinea sp.]